MVELSQFNTCLFKNIVLWQGRLGKGSPTEFMVNEKVARERFELSSEGPKPSMLDHYTTGLQSSSIIVGLFIAKCLNVAFFPNKRSSHGLRNLCVNL
jgi:hypothetical protein